MNNKMAINTYLSTIQLKKLSRRAENCGYGEHFDGYQIKCSGGVWGNGRGGERIKKYE